MGRSVSYLSNAVRINYFPWPEYDVVDENDEVLFQQYEDANIVIDDIQNHFIEADSGLSIVDRWDGREDHIILEGNGVEIALSEYCGLASLSVRVEESDYTDEETAKEGLDWIEKNWENISKPWAQYKKVGTFSNGESVYEKA